MTVYRVQSAELKSKWRSTHPAYWSKFTDRLEQEIATKAVSLNETIHFHDYNPDTPLGGGPTVLVECSDAMLAVIATMPEVDSVAPETLIPTLRRVTTPPQSKPPAPQP